MLIGKLKSELVVQIATAEDVDQVVEIEKSTWPSGEDMIADSEKFKARQQIGGLVVTKHPLTGQIFGYVSVFKPNWSNVDALTEILYNCADVTGITPEARWNYLSDTYGIPKDWHEATANGWLFSNNAFMHDPNGKVVFGIGITTDTRYQGLGIVDKTLQGAIEMAKNDGAKYFMAFSRLPSYQQTKQTNGKIPLDDYVHLGIKKDDIIVPYDYGFRFHWRMGAQPSHTKSGNIMYIGIPTAMKDDAESQNAGVLVLNPLDSQKYPFNSTSFFKQIDF